MVMRSTSYEFTNRACSIPSSILSLIGYRVFHLSKRSTNYDGAESFMFSHLFAYLICVLLNQYLPQNDPAVTKIHKQLETKNLLCS